ncbi:MAG: hypothetical protein IPO35_17755, partial [Uliginosibacterium sp.]|nr:hypothetical protein [Uliginosibacterium sp.]
TPDGKYVGPDGVEPALGVPPRNPQAGRIDPDLAIRLGLTATGVAIGGYLAGDGKLSEIAFGSVGVLGMMADKGKIPKGSAAREFKVDLAKMAEPGHKSRYRLVEMPISDFLKLAKQDSTDQVKTQRVSDVRKTGEKFDTVPYLYFDVDGRVAKVTGHEGRHRAKQLAAEGYTTIPVEVRGPIRWSEQLDPNKFDYRETWPEKLIAESGNAELPFPVSREKAASAWTPESSFAGAKSQQGFITSDQAVKLGAIASGAAIGGYLAGDEKLAGMALGAIGGLAATRLPGLGRSLGKAISPQQAFGSAMRISAALGAGYYLGGKVDHPIEGAVIASGLLIGRRFLKPAIAREGDALVNARNGNLAVWEWIRHNTKRDITEAVPDEARRTAIYEALQVGARGRLAPNEQKVFDVVTDLNAVTGRDAVDSGVLKSLRQNYVTSVVEREVVGTPNTKAELVRKIMGMAFHEDTGPSTRFARARKYDTLQELEAALRGTGLKVKTTDVAEVLDIYLKSMRKAVEDRVLINAVKQTKASDGTPYIAKRDKYGRFPRGI